MSLSDMEERGVGVMKMYFPKILFWNAHRYKCDIDYVSDIWYSFCGAV